MAKLAPTQVEQLQSIGAYLRQVRQEQGLSIEMLANQIFIRPVLLQALESGQDSALPEPVFIQGFIRRYAEALGLDGQTISKEFRVTPVDILPTPDLLEPVSTSGSNGSVESTPRSGSQLMEPSASIPTVGSARRSPLPLLLSLCALAAVLGFGAWGLFGGSGGTSQDSTSQDNSIDSAAETVPETAAPEDDIDPDAAATAEGDAEGGAQPLDPIDVSEDSPTAPLEAPVVVSADLSDRAWISVVADGENVYEGIAESGFQETWTAQTSVVFRTGNAGGVELSVNGDRAMVLGNPGVVRTLTLTPDSGGENVATP